MTVGAYSDMDSAALARLIEESFGFKMRELEARLQMGQQDISSRWDIANLQAQTSRYGIDMQARTDRQRLALMREEMEKIGIPDMWTRRYVAEKNYEIARSELSFKIAATAAELASTPDTFWMAKDFYDSLGVLQAGGKLMTFSQPEGDGPTMKSLSTLTAQLGGDNPLAAAGALVGANGPAANIDYSAVSGKNGGTGAGTAASGLGGALTGTTPATIVPTGDPRVDAAAGVMAGSPPSVGNGYTDADIQALQTIGSIYKQGLAGLGPGALESMTPDQQKLLLAGGARLGYSNADELARYKRSRLYQEAGDAGVA